MSRDNKKLVTASDDATINLYDLESGSKITTLTGHKSWVLSSHLSPDAKYLATGSSDKSVKIWDLVANECIATLNEHTDSVWGVRWNNAGTKLVSVGEDSRTIVYSLLEK